MSGSGDVNPENLKIRQILIQTFPAGMIPDARLTAR